MPAEPRSAFNAELEEALDLLGDVYRRLTSLHDLAEHDRLPRDVRRRLKLKRTVIEVAGKDLRAIHDMPGMGEASQ